jgi:hypothetical protein
MKKELAAGFSLCLAPLLLRRLLSILSIKGDHDVYLSSPVVLVPITFLGILPPLPGGFLPSYRLQAEKAK